MIRTFEFTLSQRGSVASDYDQLRLAGSEGLECGLIPKSDYRMGHPVSLILVIRAGC
jgi:hypothetical protein